MNEIYMLAVDIGTSFIKAAVYDLNGKQSAIMQVPVQSDSSRAGVFLQSGDDIYFSVLSALGGISEKIGDGKNRIAAICFTGQMAGFMGARPHWEDVTSWSCSLDTRYAPYANDQIQKYGTDFLEISGTNAPVMAPKITWLMKEFPDLAEQTEKYMLITSYVAGRLGQSDIEEAAVSSSYITWTGLADIRKKAWSQELCGRLGIPVEKLPLIVDYHTIVGKLSKEAANAVSLPSGIPLVAGAGDKIAGCIGAGILSPGAVTFEASSYAAVSVLADSYKPNMDRMDYDAIPAFETDRFYLHRYFPGSGITLQWFIDTFCGDQKASDEVFREIEALTEMVPAGSENLMAVGMLGGSAMPFDGTLRGAWVGHTWSHRKEHFYRALLEGFGYELALTLDSIKSMYQDWDRGSDIILTGGGAGSDVWSHIIADVTGCNVFRT
ncbi:MAG: hypothetical protein IKP86_11220, partial [Anaerolineaceae bacterium]|nr:hypothetical protein [Anaerolineaceae bacterium]